MGGGMHSATAALATGPQAWDELIGAVYGFDPSRRYVLLATPFVGEDADALSVIGKIPTTIRL